MQLAQHGWTEILFQALAILPQSAEPSPVDCAQLEPPQTMRAHVEICVHPALAADPAPERDRGQLPIGAIAPLMIDAGMALGIAG